MDDKYTISIEITPNTGRILFDFIKDTKQVIDGNLWDYLAQNSSTEVRFLPINSSIIQSCSKTKSIYDLSCT